MQLTAKLKEQIVKAAQTSMRIEGYASTRSPAVKAQAKALMEQQRVQVSVRSK
jgi:hypothetical protein